MLIRTATEPPAFVSQSAPNLGQGAARAAASLGPVFRCRQRDKRPLKAGWQTEATQDADTIAKLWRDAPSANVGLACGHVCWALDIDGEEGLETLADLEDMHRWLPPTVASVTGTGGLHLFFAASARVRNSVRHLGPGLDTRGVNGYVVVPPSVHPNGSRYAWLEGRAPGETPLVVAPDWLLALLDPPRPAWNPPAARKQPTSRYVAAAMRRELEAVAAAPKGQRNLILNAAAFALGRFVADGELDAADVGEALAIAAMSAGLSRHEAMRTSHSGLLAAVRRAA